MPRKHKIIGGIIIILHLVGAIGTLHPQTREFILQLTPFNLLLSTVFAFYLHEEKRPRLLILFILTFSIGLLVEIIGVKTGIPFGSYSYGATLGWKVLEVPLIIGVNWFLLTYIFGMLVSPTARNPVIKIVSAAAGMVFLDMLIEPVAIKLDYWNWEGGIPVSNYFGWFLTSLILQFIYQKMRFQIFNPYVIVLLTAQILYFCLLYFF